MSHYSSSASGVNLSRFDDRNHHQQNDIQNQNDIGEGDEDPYEQPVGFTCRIESVRDLTDVLTCLCVNVKKELPCCIEATPDSLMFMVTGRTKSTQARLNLQADLFDNFICDADSVHLSINLSTLLECLQLFGGSETTAVTMTYSSADAMFRLSLEDSGILTTCDIASMFTGEDQLEELQGGLFSLFSESSEESAMVIQSDPLKDAMQELMEVSGAGSVRLETNAAGLRISTMGSGENTCEIEFPKDSNVFVSFASSANVVWTYPLPSIQLGMKALGVAKETFIRINQDGIMCVQHQVENRSGRETFVDFLMVAEDTPQAHQENME